MKNIYLPGEQQTRNYVSPTSYNGQTDEQNNNTRCLNLNLENLN